MYFMDFARVISSIFRDIHKNTFLFILLLLFYFVIYSNIFVTWKVFKFMLWLQVLSALL